MGTEVTALLIGGIVGESRTLDRMGEAGELIDFFVPWKLRKLCILRILVLRVTEANFFFFSEMSVRVILIYIRNVRVIGEDMVFQRESDLLLGIKGKKTVDFSCFCSMSTLGSQWSLPWILS